MAKSIRKLLSICLVLVMLFNMLPLHAFAAETEKQPPSDTTGQEAVSNDVYIVEEIIDKRTEYTKQFRLSNGLHIATVYASPVHYEVDGQWEEIDNTLQLASTRSGNAYVNTAGVWQVSFPQNMTENNGVTITKDGYVFNFRMAGELLDPNIKDIIVDSEIIEIPAATEEPTAGEEENVPATEEMVPTEEPTEVPEETEATEAAEVPEEPETEPTAAEDETVETSETETTEAAAEAEQEATEEENADAEELEVNAPAEEAPSETTEPQDEAVLETAAPEAEAQATEPAVEEPAVVSAPEENVTAEIESIDMEEIKAQAEYPETVVEKISSRLTYDGIYEDTDIIFDLNSNQVKESIVLNTYRESLKGYIYMLEVGDLTPVLLEGGEIELRDADGEDVVMYMPAPYLIDAAGATCFDINVSLEGENGKYVLAYELPREWLADSERQWPVVLDPAVLANTHVSNIKDTTVYTKTYLTHTKGILALGYYTDRGLARSYIKYQNLPELTAADVIVNASLTMYKPYNSATVTSTIEVHKVNGDWASDTITWDTQPAINATVEDFVISKAAGFYTWDITDIARSWYEDANYGLMLKYPEAEENVTTASWKEFYSSEGADYRYLPNVLITFRNNNGLESYWDYTTSSAGRAGTGYVNQYTGNLVWIRDDIGFGGNRMPVTISHVYNANDSTENLFGMGYGWRTNFNQRVYHWDEDTAYGDYYVWEDSDGTDHYFLYESSKTYKDEDGLELTLTTGGSGTEKYCIKDKNGNASYFDTYGRLTKQTNNQATKSNITITYTTTSGLLISTITDGAGRVYSFTYTNNLLSKIAYKGKGTSEITYVNFGYTNSNLTSVTDKDSKVSRYTYTTNNLMSSAQDIDGYKINYAYTTTTAGEPNRIKTITEYSGSTAGGVLNITYAHNQTKFTDYNGNVQIVQFNNMGNTISIQDDQGRAQYAQYAINDPTKPDDAATTATRTTSTAKGNQLLLASKLQNTVGNVLKDSSFESSTLWTATSSAVTRAIDSTNKYMGAKSLKMVRSSAGTAAGVYSTAFSVASGETYTFSAYVKTGTGAAYLALHDGSTTVVSETLAANSGWTRLEVSYTNTSSAAKSVTARLMTAAAGTTYMDCAQVEKAPTASRYNLIENGDFTHSGYAWNTSTGRTTVTAANKAPAPQLDVNVYKMTGNPKATNRISQTVKASGASGDTFVLAGWAKADSVPIKDDREFALIATFKKGSTTVNTSTVRFNYCADSTINWQYAASPIVAKGAYDSIVIELAYDYNANTVYFDGVQLYKEEFGNSYTYDDKGNIISVKDVQSQTTSYEYTNNNLTKQILPSGAAMTYTYDDYHNVKTATSDTGVVYSFAYDTYGNNTSVSIASGSVKLTSSAVYTSDGNRLSSATNAAGKVTTYSYNENTNVLEWVQYPEDTTATRTEYDYDNMYRVASAAVDVSTGGTLSAIYGYTNDLLTSITTGSTSYDFSYGAFALSDEISIGDRWLARYSYTSRNNFLASLDYGNGDSVDYTYDNQGRVTKQTFENGDVVTYKYDNNGALASITDSATGLTTTYYYDFSDRLLRYAEKGSNFSHIVGYEYDEINNLTALVETINGTEHKTVYAYDDDNRVTSITNGSANEAYTYDAYSRVNEKVTKNDSSTILTDTITYLNPTSTTTTGQIHKLQSVASGYNVTYTYTYDDNGNILYVNSGGKTTYYVYDTANQLTRENNQAAGKTWVWTYDDAGNITSRKEYAYTTGTLGTVQSTVNYSYGDSDWGDLLTGYGNYTIDSDAIGNPTTVKQGNTVIRSYTWEHGRKLASLTENGNTWSYTYNADGLRTQRTNGSTTYNYIYNGGSLSQMTVGSNTLYFAYDTSGNPLAVTYNGTNYYYATNQQGDVTAILNTSGSAVVQYTYDAWGKILTTTGSMASTLGVHNPLRYRGYVYDQETQLYYLQSRYYDPAMGRFINADDPANLGVKGLLSYNLFAYCGNNPVMGYDPTGTWDWGAAISGAGLLTTGLTALAAAATILTCGAAAPLMVAVATVTAAAGVLTTVNGVAEVVEAGTGYNVVRDGVFGGNTKAYETYRDVTSTVAEIGTAICGSYYAAKGGNVCFVAGTLVQTEQGEIPIENVSVGTMVWAWDEETGDVALKEVVETYINQTDELLYIFVDGEEIVTTPEHPFYSPVKGWTEAAHLRAGDILVLVNGDYVVVEKVQHEILEASVTVYNFQVKDYHTYYVTDTGVLVHNSCAKKSTGSYEIFTSSNQVYVGKGSTNRMNASIRRLTRQGYEVIDYSWTASKNHATAFVDEYMKMAKYDFDFGGKLINKIMSPGFKLFNAWL